MTTNDYAEPAAELTTGGMPLLGFGTWQIRNSAAPEVTAQALEATHSFCSSDIQAGRASPYSHRFPSVKEG